MTAYMICERRRNEKLLERHLQPFPYSPTLIHRFLLNPLLYLAPLNQQAFIDPHSFLDLQCLQTRLNYRMTLHHLTRSGATSISLLTTCFDPSRFQRSSSLSHLHKCMSSSMRMICSRPITTSPRSPSHPSLKSG